MKTRIIAVAAITLAVALLSGCALTVDRITITHKAEQGVVPVPGASDITVTVAVVDDRQDKSKVSVKKNGFGMEMAPIVAIEEVSTTIRGAIEKELKARGFQLGPKASLVHISADITRFYNDHKTGFFAGDAVADLNLTVVVNSKEGAVLYTRQIIAQGVEPNTQLMTGNNAMLALDRALDAGMHDLFADHEFIAALIAVRPAAVTSKPTS